MIRVLFHLIIIALLTVLTQIGGLAYLLALVVRRGFFGRMLAFVCLYALVTVGAVFAAPLFGRESMPCFGDEDLAPRSLLYCALNRQYVTPELKLLTQNLARDVNTAHPGTVTQYMDASFPFGTGFPLMPHLSHDDGKKLDLAFYYERDGYRPAETPSPLGYWGFLEPHADDPETCRDTDRFTLRWDMGWFQRFVRDDLTMETARTATMLRWLADEAVKGGVEKILLEPHLRQRFALPPQVVRFQGCRAARHDDHVHFQVR
jgi:hypothetical protein